MTEDLHPTDISVDYWQEMVTTDYTHADYLETFRKIHDTHPDMITVLGHTGMVLATQIRAHDFGQLPAVSGTGSINDRKIDSLWLGIEAAAIKENLEGIEAALIYRVIGEAEEYLVTQPDS